MCQHKGEIAGTCSDFENSFSKIPVDCHQNNIKDNDDIFFVITTRRITDKVALCDHPYSKTFRKRRVSKRSHKEINLNVDYSEHSQRGVSINLHKESNNSKQKK